MIKQYKELSKRYQDYLDNETPFKQIDYKNHIIKLFWSKRSGVYGYQVIYTVLEIGLGYILTGTTGGCGHCKESGAKQSCLIAVGFKTKDHFNYDLWPHHVGGNYYNLNKRVKKS